jgi:photosystem II stability/assembly factor-like uncharacterized protein
MKRLLPFVLLIILGFKAVGQTVTRMQSWGLDLEAAHWINSQQGIAVGENLIIRTHDGGTTWQEVLQRFDTRFYGVVFLDEENGAAVGEKGTIYITQDSGQSWQRRETGTQNDLHAIATSSTSQLIAVGSNGEIIASTDKGLTWIRTSSGTTLDLHDIFFVNESIGYIAAAAGSILKTENQGTTWSLTHSGQAGPLYGVTFSNELIGYAVGESGLFIKTIDGGESWAALNPGTTHTLRKVAFSPASDRIVTAVGDSATVVRTSNSGTSFTKSNFAANFTRNLKDISFKPSTNQASVVGQDGYLSISTNGGANWSGRLAGIRNHFTAVDFVALNRGYIAGQNGELYLTSNGAVALSARPLPEPVPVHTLNFWNNTYGFAGTTNGKIYRTSDGGTSWIPTFTPANRSISGFHLFTTASLYLSGSQGYISKSVDSGITWDQSIQTNTTANLSGIVFFNPSQGFAIGEKGHISWTANGTTWESLAKVTDKDLNDLAKVDTARAFVVGDGGILLKTVDKGKTWEKVELGISTDLASIEFFGATNGFIAGAEGMALATTDAGETWIQIPSGTIRDLRAVSAGTAQKAYFVGNDGTILSFTCVPPTESLGQIVGDAQSCLGTSSYSVEDETSDGSEIIWRVDGGTIVSGQGTGQITVSWSKTGRNALFVNRSNFCGRGSISSLEVTVADIPVLSPTISGDGAVCRETPYSYSLPKTDGLSYEWTVTGGEIQKGQGTHSVDVIWNQDGPQSITVSQENYCGRSESIEKPITVSSVPTAPIAIDGETITALGQQTYEIEALPGLNYRWTISDSGGKIISGQGSASVVVEWEKEGDFELAVEAQNQCGFSTKSTLPVLVNIITAIEPPASKHLRIYPNPSNGQLTISADRLDSWSRIVVFNAVGQSVREEPISRGQKEIFLQSLPKGLLLIQLQNTHGVISRKIYVK